MKQLAVLLLLISLSPLFAQENVKRYTWDEKPEFEAIPAEFQDYPAVVLKDYRLYENKIGYYQYKAFVVKHCAIKILKTEAINDYNKVTIDKRYVRDYRDLRARVIKPDGRIEELPRDRIVEKQGSDGRQFVFEGVAIGDIIEYFYVIKDFPDLSGVEYFSRDIPVLDAKFQINDLTGGNMYVKGYNGMTRYFGNGRFTCSATNLPAYKMERSATNYANLAKVYYFAAILPQYGYDEFYQSLVWFADGVSAKGMIRDLVRSLDLENATVPLDDRLRKLDIYLKENIAIERGSQVAYKRAIENKRMNPSMALYLFKDVLDYLKIPYHFVVSTDRFNDRIDMTQAIPAALSEVLIYIPETGKYISPFNYFMPYGPPNAECLGSDGILYTQNGKGVDFRTHAIGTTSMDDNVQTTQSIVTLADDMESVSISKKNTYTGYNAYYFRRALQNLPEDREKEYVKDIAYEETDAEVKKYNFANIEYRHNYDPDRPFTIATEADIKESWVENAGRNYLISIGKAIGYQTNLYQETTRVHDIDLLFPKRYEHVIRFDVPGGYRAQDLSPLQFNKELKDAEGNVIGKFASTARLEGNTVVVSVEEFYNFVHLDKSQYPAYRDLINTAYDFYKSALMLEKS